jgi:hypothetical protein
VVRYRTSRLSDNTRRLLRVMLHHVPRRVIRRRAAGITRGVRMTFGWRNVLAGDDLSAEYENKSCALSGVFLQDNAQKWERLAQPKALRWVRGPLAGEDQDCPRIGGWRNCQQVFHPKRRARGVRQRRASVLVQRISGKTPKKQLESVRMYTILAYRHPDLVRGPKLLSPKEA